MPRRLPDGIVAWAALMMVFGSCTAKGQMELSLTPSQTTFHGREPVRITWKLRNTTNQPWIIFSHTEASSGNQFDQLTLEVQGPSGKRSIHMVDRRAASRYVACELAGGGHLEHTFDLAAWAGPLQPGKYKIMVSYKLSESLVRLLTGRSFPSCGASKSTVSGISLWTETLSSESILFSITQ